MSRKKISRREFYGHLAALAAAGAVVHLAAARGETFRVQILDASDEQDRVLATHGPYPCA